MCVCVCLPLGVQVSEISKALLGLSSIVSSSGSLNSVGLVFEKEGRCSTFHLKSSGALHSFFSYSSLNFQLLLLFFLLFQPFFVCFVLLKTALTHSHVRGLYGRKKGMVSRCECVFLPWLFKGICKCVCMCVHASECVLSAAYVCELELIVLLGHVKFK